MAMTLLLLLRNTLLPFVKGVSLDQSPSPFSEDLPAMSSPGLISRGGAQGSGNFGCFGKNGFGLSKSLAFNS